MRELRLSVFTGLLLLTQTFGATYNGQSLDGRKWDAGVRSGSEIFKVTVTFDKDTANIYFTVKPTLVKLASETVADPHNILVSNKEGKWVIDLPELK